MNKFGNLGMCENNIDMNKKILIIEPNPFHAEVIPGVVKYFEDIGYCADIFVQPSVQKDNAFCWYPGHINIQAYEFDDIRQLLSTEKITHYDFVFFSSMEFIFHNVITNIIQYLGFIPKTKYGILGIYHTTSLIDLFQDFKLASEGRFFCFSDFQIHNYNISVLNPHYFGNLKTTKADENSIICVGNAFDINMLSDELYKLYKNKHPVRIIHYGGRKRTLLQKIKQFIKTIIISILSLFNASFFKKRIFRKYITEKGRVGFEELFSAIIKCKYILVLINPHDKAHTHYMTHTTSGIMQIILGFKKIPIIHEDVALKYGFDQTNSILYNNTNIFSALSLALNNNAYCDMVDSINILEDSIYKLSLENLNNTILSILSSRKL